LVSASWDSGQRLLSHMLVDAHALDYSDLERSAALLDGPSREKVDAAVAAARKKQRRSKGPIAKKLNTALQQLRESYVRTRDGAEGAVKLHPDDMDGVVSAISAFVAEVQISETDQGDEHSAKIVLQFSPAAALSSRVHATTLPAPVSNGSASIAISGHADATVTATSGATPSIHAMATFGNASASMTATVVAASTPEEERDEAPRLNATIEFPGTGKHGCGFAPAEPRRLNQLYAAIRLAVGGELPPTLKCMAKSRRGDADALATWIEVVLLRSEGRLLAWQKCLMRGAGNCGRGAPRG